MTNNGERRRIGYIRLSGLTWKMNWESINKKIGQANIIETVHPQQDGKELDALDIIFIHPDFDEVDEGDPIPLYSYNFATREFRHSA